MITVEKLRALFNYDPDTGVFTRLTRRGRFPAGSVAGHLRGKDGYLTIMIDGREYPAHRLAWLYTHGRWPTVDIDHKDGIRHNNRLLNLREATGSINAQNRHKASSLSSTGLLGVYMNRGAPRARITIHGGRRIDLGRFETPELAHAAYIEAKRKFHEGNTL